MTKQTTAAFLMVVLGLFQPGLADLRAQGPQEGIKVHGHWTIDVRQPDGTLVTHREFENALLLDGTVLLRNLLVKYSVPGDWVLRIDSIANPGPCLEDVMRDHYCAMSAAVGAPNSGVNVYRVVLNGTVAVERNSQIEKVSSGIGECAPTILVGDCSAVQGGNFTAAVVAPPIPVVAGQIVQVTVAISFS